MSYMSNATDTRIQGDTRPSIWKGVLTTSPSVPAQLNAKSLLPIPQLPWRSGHRDQAAALFIALLTLWVYLLLFNNRRMTQPEGLGMKKSNSIALKTPILESDMSGWTSLIRLFAVVRSLTSTDTMSVRVLG